MMGVARMLQMSYISISYWSRDEANAASESADTDSETRTKGFGLLY